MASKAAVQTARLLSTRGLRRRRLGHIGPNFFDDSVDKWGHKKTGGPSNLLAGGQRTPRASLVLGQQPKRNGLNAASESPQYQNGNALKRIQPLVNGRMSLNGLKASGTLNAQSDKINGGSQDKIDPDKNKSAGGYSSDLIVVLDMDECLIHSQFLSDHVHEKYRQDEERPSGGSPFGYSGEEAESIITATCESFRISLPDGDLVHVNKRPNLDIFLKEITSRFETHIFTAAMSVYAAPLLNELDPNGDMFQDRFFREHCLFHPELGVYAKDLCDVLKKRKTSINTKNDNELNGGDCEHACDERRIVLVDNNPLSFLPNPSNGILVSSFYDDPKDDTLEAVMELLNELEHVDDVRPILDERFGLKDALNDVIRETSWR
jgi:CTD small phosphatase-like protein 2